nr:hypothetical protein [Herbaspirillum sp. ASV7]
MQKVKTSKLPLAMVALTALLQGTVPASHAEDAAAQANASADSMDQNVTLGDMIKLSKQASEREFAAKLNPGSRKSVKDTPAEPALVEKNPVLLALYGIDRNYKAELDVNGQSRVVQVPGPLSKMGPWKYIVLMEDGVLLTRSPPDSNPPASNRTGSATRGTAALACQQKETCLFLSVPKAGSDSRSLVTPDAQARLLASQLPGAGRAPALEFGGKPQPLEERINMGTTRPAPR